VPGTTADTSEILLREPRPDDAEVVAEIVFNAFGQLHDHHRFQRDFPELAVARGMMDAWIPHPGVWGVVAEIDGTIVGCNFLDERDEIRGVGPITIDPDAQNAGVGRKLMDAVIERGRDARGIRLLQDAFHMRSLSLYTKLGFRVTDGCLVMTGEPAAGAPSELEVRPLTEGDLEECGRLCQAVHGFDRNGALGDAVKVMRPFAAIRDGRIVAYASALDSWPMAHGVAENDEDMQSLLVGGAEALGTPITLLVPTESELFPWALDAGLRAVKPMNVMSMGFHQEPQGSWFPSVLY
jgi:GNAT superfamily N-acetyltransferase